MLRIFKYVRADRNGTEALRTMTSGELPTPTLEKVVHALVAATIDKQALGARWIDEAYADDGHEPTRKQSRLQEDNGATGGLRTLHRSVAHLAGAN